MAFPSPSALKKKFSLNPNTFLNIQKHRNQIQEIIQGRSPLWAIVVGPCSLHDTESALHYAKKLRVLQEKVEKTCLLVMRAHAEKPRTYLGWKGLVYDPNLDGSCNIQEGLSVSRELYLQIANLNIPIATEFLEPLISSYLSDLISWGFIGARTSSSQIHRQLASSLSMPIGFKNSTDGNLDSAIQGALTAQASHSFIHIDDLGTICQVKSSGNPNSHVVLRGTSTGPNYKSFDIQKTLKLSEEKGLNTRILVDCAHDNSIQKPFDQRNVCHNVLEQHLSGNHKIMGLMMESHLKEGSQSIESSFIDPSISLTDPCINWEETESLIYNIHETLLESALCFS